MRILFTWELGAGLGHLTREAPVALALQRRGHQVLFAVRETRSAAAVLARDGLAYVQAPVPMLAKAIPHAPESYPGYASVLAAWGFGEVDCLHGLIAAWRHLFTAFAPDVVVSDFSPAAQLCARLCAYPTLQIALPWELPPGTRHLPVFPHGRSDAGRLALAETEQRVLANLREVCHREGLPAVNALGEIYTADRRLISGIAELDCFAARRKQPHYVGPLYGTDFGVRVRWPRGTRKVFAYLQPAYMQGPAALEVALAALRQCGAAVIAAVPGAPESLLSAYSGGRMRVSREPVHLAAILRGADLVVSNAGAVILARCALAGVPMLLLPHQMEQRLNAARAKAAGVARVLAKENVETRFATELKRMLDDDACVPAARHLARRHAGWSLRKNVENIARKIENLGA